MTAEAEIRRRIHTQGAITFAEFMDVALYWPDGGYYTSAEPFGASGDYYTSPTVHPVFGALLSVQLYQMWQLLDSPTEFTVVEMGAGNGQLSRDILESSKELPKGFGNAIRYVSLDQRVTAGEELEPGEVSRIVAAGVPLNGITGCFLSNELLDAFAVHQVRSEAGRLREAYVALEGEGLVRIWDEPSTPELSCRLESIGVQLAEGQITEINLGLEPWVEEVAEALKSGFVLTIDYGQPAFELYSSKVRPQGTLTTFYRHAQTDDPFRRIGQQDISVQVDFTSLANAGQRAGLETLGFTAQGRFLANLGHRRLRDKLRSLTLPPNVMQANQAGLMDVVKPVGLGDFKVLAQGKNVGQVELWGFDPDEKVQSLVEQLDFPLLTPRHISLPEGRGISAESEFVLEQLWPWDDEPQ